MRVPAVVFTAKERVEFQEVEVPEAGPDDAIVRTQFSWISNGTEGSFLRQERFDGITPWQPFMPLPYPMVPGYQKVGVIESLGANVKGFKVGQQVFATITKTTGTHLGFGGHILRGPSAASEILALPEGVDPVAYSGLVLTQVAFNSAIRPPVDKNTPVLVMGDGMIGIWSAQLLQKRGARVALVGRHDFRLNLMQKRPDDMTLNSKRDSQWMKKALDWAGGTFPVIIDTIGNETNFDVNLALIPHLSREGHWVATGHEGFKAWMDMKQFIYHEVTIHCPCGWTRQRLGQTLQHIHAGDFQTLPLITHRMAADQAAAAWQKIFTARDSTLGVILEWDTISGS